MSKRSRHPAPNPDNPAHWIGQPYIPRSLFFPWSRSGVPLFSFFVELIKHPNKRGCFLAFWLVGVVALAWLALIAIGFVQDNGLGFWALLVLIGAAIAGTLAGSASARQKRQVLEERHHHKAR